MKEIIDLSSDESISSKVTTSSNDVDGNKRKREKELDDSSPSKIKKEYATAPIVEDTVNENSRVFTTITATNYQSIIKKKLPLEEDTVLTIERVVVSSPKVGPLLIKKKVPVDDDLLLLSKSHMSSPVQNALKVALDRDMQHTNEANQPPWWFNLATDIGDDIISILRSK